MDESALKVILRDFDKERDQAFIYASWRNGWFYSNIKKPDLPDNEVFRDKTAQIKQILNKAAIKIACLDETPNVIIGYSIATGTHLDWIYVKVEYRNKGIGALLMPKNIETVTKDLTDIGKCLVKKKNLKTA